MDDYSTYMAEFPRKISELNNLLNNKEWLKAKELSDSMQESLQIISDIAWSKNKSGTLQSVISGTTIPNHTSYGIEQHI